MALTKEESKYYNSLLSNFNSNLSNFFQKDVTLGNITSEDVERFVLESDQGLAQQEFKALLDNLISSYIKNIRLVMSKTDAYSTFVKQQRVELQKDYSDKVETVSSELSSELNQLAKQLEDFKGELIKKSDGEHVHPELSVVTELTKDSHPKAHELSEHTSVTLKDLNGIIEDANLISEDDLRLEELGKMAYHMENHLPGGGDVIPYATVDKAGLASPDLIKIVNVLRQRSPGKGGVMSGHAKEHGLLDEQHLDVDLTSATDGQVMLYNSSTKKWKAGNVSSTGSSLPVADTTSIIKGSDDDTKLLRIEVDGFSTATTRVLTPQNKDYTIADAADVTLNTTHRISDGSDHTFIGQSVVSGATPTFTGTNFTGIDHGTGLLGLTDDDHTQYGLLAGRSGGQILVGSTLTTEDLTLRDNAVDLNDVTISAIIAHHADATIHFTQANITTVGTVETGVWQGTAVADAYVAGAATWNAKQDALTFGIADTNSVVINSIDVASGEYAKFTASGLESKTFAEVKTDLSLNLVENTALSTWAGSANVTTVGVLATGSITTGFGNIDIGASSLDCGVLTVGGTSGANYRLDSQSGEYGLLIQSQTSAQPSHIGLFAKDGDGTDDVYIRLYAVGTPTATTDTEELVAGWATSVASHVIFTTAGGTGVVKPLRIFTGTNITQFVLNTDNSIDMSGVIKSGTWNGGAIAGQYGGTGVANTGKTITLGGNLTTSGAFTTTLTVTANTNVTLPISGTLLANVSEDTTPQLGGTLDGQDNITKAVETQDISESSQAVSSSAGVVTIDYKLGNATTTMAENITDIVMTNLPATGKDWSLKWEMALPAATAYTLGLGTSWKLGFENDGTTAITLPPLVAGNTYKFELLGSDAGTINEIVFFYNRAT